MALAWGCATDSATTGTLDLPVALEARASIRPIVAVSDVAASETGVTLELLGAVTDIAVRRAPYQWRIEVEAGTTQPVGRPPGDTDSPFGFAGVVPPEPTDAVQTWVLTLGVAAGLEMPFDEGDRVWVRRHLRYDSGRSKAPPASDGAPPAPSVDVPGTVRESVAMGLFGQPASLVFADGPVPLMLVEDVPGQARPTSSPTVVYVTSGRDERSCHRVVEHRSFGFLGDPKRRLRPGESTVTQVETQRWTVTAVDLAVTVESSTCPDLLWDRSAWLAVRDRDLAPLTPQ